MGPVIWSKLSKDVKNAESIYSFKKKIRKVDLEQVITESCKTAFYVVHKWHFLDKKDTS